MSALCDAASDAGIMHTTKLVTTACLIRLVIGSRASALLSVTPSSPLPLLSVLSATPPDSRSCSRALPRGQRARRQTAAPQRFRQPPQSAVTRRAEIRSGVGRVARRARLVIKPYFDQLPRLTLKAGRREDCPQPYQSFATTAAPRFRFPFLKKCIPLLSILFVYH
jgi:hypothetical protein